MNNSDWPTIGEHGAIEPEPHLDVTRALLGRKWMLVFFALVGGGLGYLQFAKTPPTYSSSTRIAVEWNRPPLKVDSDGTAYYYEDPIAGHIARIMSPIILQPAIDDRTTRLTSLSSIGASNPMRSLLNGLSVTQDENSDDILHIRFTGPSREDCPKVIDAVITAYTSYLERSQKTSAEEALRLITQLKDELIESIDRTEREYQEFRDKAQLLWAGGEGLNIHAQRMAQIEEARSQLMLERVTKQSRAASIAALVERGENREALLMILDQLGRTEGELATEGDKPVTADSQLMQTEMEREMLLSQGMGLEHPRVRLISKRIELLKSVVQREAELAEAARAGAAPPEPAPDILVVYQDALRQELAMIDAQLAGLGQSFTEEERLAKALADDENKNRAFVEDLQRKKTLYDSVLDKLESVELTGELGGFSAHKMENPSLGVQIAPNLSRCVSIGAVLGVLAALVVSILIEMTDRSFRDPSQIAKLLGVPVVGHVPALVSSKDRRLLKDSPIDATIVTYHRPSSRQAEAYRVVRAALMIGAQGSRRVVQVTSPHPGDGKTTLSANLAVAIAKSGKRCLLMDCDFRRPRVHRVFGLPNTIGISSLIRDGVDLPDVTYTGGIADLDILPAGPRAENPGELLLSPRFSELMLMLREQYDFIIVDTPPVLAVSDASAVASMVDGILLVTRISRDNRPLATRARQTLELVGGRLSGVVVNAVDELGAYGSYSNYGYRHNRYYGKYYVDEPHQPPHEPVRLST